MYANVGNCLLQPFIFVLKTFDPIFHELYIYIYILLKRHTMKYAKHKNKKHVEFSSCLWYSDFFFKKICSYVKPAIW